MSVLGLVARIPEAAIANTETSWRCASTTLFIETGSGPPTFADSWFGALETIVRSLTSSFSEMRIHGRFLNGEE